jgi:hypothetical protein
MRPYFLFSPYSGARMSSAPFALFLRVIRPPVFGRPYSGAPTRFHADLYGILRKLEGEGPKYFARRANHSASQMPNNSAQILAMQPFARFPLGRAGNRLQNAV